MFAAIKHVMLAGVLLLVVFQSHATDTWTGWKNIASLEVVETGGFLITFSTPLTASCAGAGPATVYVYATQNGMTADGVKAHYATALLAFASGKQVSVMYDSASTMCWGRYIAVQ